MTWKVETRKKWYCIYDEMGWYVAGCQSERQAQLIANAPEMLEALEAIAELDSDYWCGDHELGIVAVCDRSKEIARAAIAAVKGEDSEDVENHNDELA